MTWRVDANASMIDGVLMQGSMRCYYGYYKPTTFQELNL
jgi:hypothetical protein